MNSFLKRKDFFLILSKIIGFLIIIFSSLIKIPQIYKIFLNMKGRSISQSSLLIEITVNVISFTYHRFNKFPISTYGETFTIFVQNLLIGYLLFHLSNNFQYLIWNFFLIFIFLYIFLIEKNFLSNQIINFIWFICIPLSIFHKIPQILILYKSKKCNEFSILTSFLIVLGSFGRLFTTFQELNNKILISSFLNTFLNTIIFILFFKYKN